MKTPKISARLFRALGILVLLIIVFHSLIYQWVTYNNITKEIYSRGKILAYPISKKVLSNPNPTAVNITELNDLCEQLMINSNDIRSVAVINPDGRVLASNAAFSGSGKIEGLPVLPAGENFFKENSNSIDLYLPIGSSQSTNFLIHVSFTKAHLAEQTWESLAVSLIFAVMTIPLFLFAIYWLTNSVFGIRLDRLLNGFDNLAKGNLAYRLVKDGRSQRNEHYFSNRDELDTIMESFDEMAARLENIDNKRSQQEERLSFLATHDQLTELPNRLMMEQVMKRAIARAKRNKQIAFLLLMDVDNFKLVNDALGHAAGDQVLRTISQILQTMMRGSDLLARMGGDEFMLLLEDIDSIAEARSVAERMCNAINEHGFSFKTHNFHLSLSIGIVAMDGIKEVSEVLAQADTALFNAKRWGRNRVVLYGTGEESKNRLVEASLWVTKILEAIKEDRFCLYFQPVVHLENNQIDHYEALLRLKNDDGTTIAPGDFLPIAEQFGLMPRIDRWVVKETIGILHKKSKLHLFMNLSSYSLSDMSILEYIEAEMGRADIAPGRLGFEITETAVVQDLELAESWIRRLKILGCRFALDDFGAGFSSFLYLRNLPLDQIKLDGFFIRTLGREASQRNVVQAMHELANALQIETVAEYVEDQEIVTVLKEIGVRFGQGNFLGLPDPEFQRRSQLLDSVV